jgi:hypothetical protein
MRDLINIFRKIFLLGIIIVSFSPNFIVHAKDNKNIELGFRGGVDTGKISENMHSYEVYLLYVLPFHIVLSEKVLLKTRLDTAVNYLDVESEDGMMISLGGDVYLDIRQFLELEIGFRPTIMSNYTLGNEDFGGGLQFTSHIGAAFYWKNLVINYRLQHTSNAHIYDTNPGFNLHLWGLGYRF